MPTHAQLDQRSLALHRLVVGKVRRQPQCMQQVRGTLAGWQARVSAHVQPYLAEWAALLAQGDEAALAMAVEDSPRACALRQSSPFCGVLTAQERHAFLRDWRTQQQGASA